MANEIRARFNLVSGTLSGALTNVATSMSAAGLSNLGVIDSTNYAAITIENEIVWVTAHTAAATTATIVRAQEGTTAAAHNINVAWQHGATKRDIDDRALGQLNYAQVIANQGTFTAETDLTSLTVTVYVPAGRRLRITGSAMFGSSVAGDLVRMVLQEDGTQVASSGVAAQATPFGAHVDTLAVRGPGAGSHVYKLRAARDNGTGNITMIAAATFPAFILVEDIGTGTVP